MELLLRTMEVASGQGWNDESVMLHCLQFIYNRRQEDAFIKYLKKAAEEENDGAEAVLEET